MEVEIREYVIYSTDWAQDGATYNGFKGTCPVFSPDGKTVYIVTFNKVSALYAFDVATGNEKWRYVPPTKTGSYNMLTVNPVTGRYLLRYDKQRAFLRRHAGRQAEVDLRRSGFDAERRPGRQRRRNGSLYL